MERSVSLVFSYGLGTWCSIDAPSSTASSSNAQDGAHDDAEHDGGSACSVDSSQRLDDCTCRARTHAKLAGSRGRGLAIVVFETYESVGLGLLKNAWLTFDLVWAIALVVAGCVTLLL